MMWRVGGDLVKASFKVPCGGRVKPGRRHNRLRLRFLASVSAAGRILEAPSARPGGQDRPTPSTSGRPWVSATARLPG